MEAKWYAVQSYSGHENKVQRLVQLKIDEEPGDLLEKREIQEVLVPTQDVTEIRKGKRVSVSRRLYPGYVLVRMLLNERTQHAVSNIQGVIKFVGSGGAPQPLRQEEINKVLGIEVEARLGYLGGDGRPPAHIGEKDWCQDEQADNQHQYLDEVGERYRPHATGPGVNQDDGGGDADTNDRVDTRKALQDAAEGHQQ